MRPCGCSNAANRSTTALQPGNTTRIPEAAGIPSAFTRTQRFRPVTVTQTLRARCSMQSSTNLRSMFRPRGCRMSRSTTPMLRARSASSRPAVMPMCSGVVQRAARTAAHRSAPECRRHPPLAEKNNLFKVFSAHGQLRTTSHSPI